MYNLLLFARVMRSNAFWDNITDVALGWRRDTRAVGGYGMGMFALAGTKADLIDFYNRQLGARIVENTLGLVTWEGEIVEMRLAVEGQEYLRSLYPERWVNRANVLYSYPSAEDTEQGNLTYNPGVSTGFQDDGQDFSDWQTAAGNAVYRISVTNSDGTVAWGFLGAAFTTTNPNDSIYTFTDVERTTAGWNGEQSGKTPSTYEVSHVTMAGQRQETTWSENTDSSSEYGEMEYVVSLPGSTPEAAEMRRDSLLTEKAWPRSRMVGGVALEAGRATGENRLEVVAAGYWHTLNRQYRETSRIAAASDLIATLVGLSEFVTAGRIETNEIAVKADCEPIPQRLGDLIEDIILVGDASQNVWQGGVYADREFIYEQAPTTVTYYLRDGLLVDEVGVPAIPTMLRPGFLLMNAEAPTGGQPPGVSSAWDDSQVAYVDGVEFAAPNRLVLQLGGEAETIVVEQQVLGGYV